METVIISVGGSLIVPDTVDTGFLQKFKATLDASNKRFVIITGGGKTARNYQHAASSLAKVSEEQLDWIGIAATTLNAQLVHALFDDVHKTIVHNPTKKIDFKEKYLIASGWKPGCSTDTDAILLAENLNITKVINLSNIDHVYDKDPKKHEDARPIKETSWQEFRALLPNEWSPGLNAPFDPIAAEKAAALNITVAIMGGDMNNLNNYLAGKPFTGTTIR
ncbi:MAG: UMP kinase [Candidatus Woesearchaeota archaeon]|nr:UMP kinase [Candidatus Woesearchaeota archaeon]